MNTKRRLALTTLVLAALLVGALLGNWSGRHFGTGRDTDGASQTTGSRTSTEGRTVLYWYDPMKPEQHFGKPGKSPYMDMALLPKYADARQPSGGITIDPRIVQNLGIRIATVETGELQPSVTATGILRWNERQVAIVQARSAGFVARVYGRAPGDIVGRGARLADLLLPDWTGAQAEFLALRQRADPDLIASARERLRHLGMPDDLIKQVEASGKPQSTVAITAPIAGVIQSMDVRQGMAVSIGATLAELRGTDPIWVEADIPEALASLIATGSASKTTLAAYPGRALAGTVIAVLPSANADSRTVRARIELRNPDGRLRDGMFAQVSIAPRQSDATALIPSEAIIRSGARNLVILTADNRHFEPVEITVGMEAGGKTQVLHGLEAGQQVVVSGQFLIDSEASLQGALTRMQATAPVDQVKHEGHTP